MIMEANQGKSGSPSLLLRAVELHCQAARIFHVALDLFCVSRIHRNNPADHALSVLRCASLSMA